MSVNEKRENERRTVSEREWKDESAWAREYVCKIDQEYSSIWLFDKSISENMNLEKTIENWQASVCLCSWDAKSRRQYCYVNLEWHCQFVCLFFFKPFLDGSIFGQQFIIYAALMENQQKLFLLVVFFYLVFIQFRLFF